MPKQIDFKEEWRKTKAQFMQLSKEAVKVAKKGEKEFIKFSKQSRLHVDSATIVLKKEHLYHLIGKEYASLKDPSQPSAKLTKLMEELKDVELHREALQEKIKQGQKG